jgi:hypothetical protein
MVSKRGFTLDAENGEPDTSANFCRPRVRMSQQKSPGLPAEPGKTSNQHPDAGPGSEMGGAEELPSERSKFSRWLASFGLGETPIPLLRPKKHTR